MKETQARRITLEKTIQAATEAESATTLTFQKVQCQAKIATSPAESANQRRMAIFRPPKIIFKLGRLTTRYPVNRPAITAGTYCAGLRW